MREKGEKWSSSEINGPSVSPFVKFVYRRDEYHHPSLRRRRFAARGAFHDLWWQGQEDKKKGHRSPSMRSREHTENSRRRRW